MSQIRTDAKVVGGAVIVAWVVAVLTLGYMIPWAVACTRGKSNSGAIGLVNFLAGWTAIGWIVALVMACGTHQVVSAVQPVASVPSSTWVDVATGHTLMLNAVTGQPMRIDPVTGQPWIEPAEVEAD